MTCFFNPRQRLIVVEAELEGPVAIARVRLALDTAATGTSINLGPLIYAGYNLALAQHPIQITTSSGVAFAPRLPLTRLKALDQERLNFPVLCHSLPPSFSVDGLLGLDFLRGQVLTVDFRAGQITLS